MPPVNYMNKVKLLIGRGRDRVKVSLFAWNKYVGMFFSKQNVDFQSSKNKG